LPFYALLDANLINNEYPVIGKRIEMLWGSAELQKYLNDLIYDDRGDREGFPRHIAAAILRLHRIHGKLVSEDHRNVWVKATY
jgi:hypothetical protein